MPDIWKQRLATWKRRFRAFANAKATKTTAFISAALTVIAGAVCSYLNWVNPADMSKKPEHLRNIILMIAGITAFAISIWRARIADKQAQASNTQAEATIEQIKIAAQSQITDRFTRAIEQLGKSGDDILFLRIGAIQALERIGNDSRDDLPAVIRLLAGFARETSIAWYKSIENQGYLIAKTPPDVAEAVIALVRLNGKHFEFIREQNIFVDLSGSHFPILNFPNSNLARFVLANSDLRGSNFWNSDLSDADFGGANLSNADFWSADLNNTNFFFANLSNAKFRYANLKNTDFRFSDFSGADIGNINRDSKTGKIREGTTELLSSIRYDRDNPPINCPEGVTLPLPQGDED